MGERASMMFLDLLCSLNLMAHGAWLQLGASVEVIYSVPAAVTDQRARWDESDDGRS